MILRALFQYLNAPRRRKFLVGLLRWVLLPLSMASALAFAVANTAPSDTAHVKLNPIVERAASGVPDTGGELAASGASNASEVQELKARLKELEDATRKNYEFELENQHKRVDWWMTFLGVLAAIMAIAGGLIPFLMGRKDKELIEAFKMQSEMLLKDIEGMRDKVRGYAKDSFQEMEELEAAKKTLENFVSGSAAVNEKVQEAAEKVEQDKTTDPLLRLRAEAVSASKPGSAEKAYKLWATLAELSEQDASAHFNAGYWAQELGVRAELDEKMRWLRQAGSHYAQGLALKPDSHEAAYNWGNALKAEAEASAVIDLATARELWRQAGEKYRQALTLKPDKHNASNNWGVALADEANALAATDFAAAHELWRQAGEKYRQGLAFKPDLNEAAYNWGNVLAAEAATLSGIDPGAARGLWREAGEKYRQALAIKPDDHEAANSWGAALIGEANTIAESEPEELNRLLEQAEQLLLQHAGAAPGVVAYNLACVYGVRSDVQNCLHWLKVCQKHGKLSSCEYVHKDKDLDPVRNDPEFIAWLQQACSSQEAAATQDKKA